MNCSHPSAAHRYNKLYSTARLRGYAHAQTSCQSEGVGENNLFKTNIFANMMNKSDTS